MKHHRRSIRLKEYDYTQSGLYFITICTNNRDMIFGEVVDGNVILNKWGEIVKYEWLQSEKLRQNIKMDDFVIMPNHFHGIIEIVNGDDGRGSTRHAPTTEQFCKPVINSIPTIIRAFKSAVTKNINNI